MKLSNAARYFDKEPVYDAYTGDLLFKCQFSTFNDAQSSGATSRRRVMSAAPSVTIPTHRVLRIFGDPWIAGSNDTDGYRGEAIRGNYNLKKATGLFNILTPAEACLSAAGVSAYAQFSYYKDTIDSITTSDTDPFWNAFFPNTVTANKGAFIRKDSTLYRVRSAYLTDDLYHLAQCDELESAALVNATFTNLGTFDILTDSYTPISTVVPAIAIEMPKFYKLQTQAEEFEKPGDATVFVAKASVTPTVGSTFAMGGRPWKVIAVVGELDAWAMHVRRA